MITRRTTLALLPASLISTVKPISLAFAEQAVPDEPAVPQDPAEADRVIAWLEPWRAHPINVRAQYDATVPLVRFFAHLAKLTPGLTRKSEFRTALMMIDNMNLQVNAALETRKQIDPIIDKDRRRRITPFEKARNTTENDLVIHRVKEILQRYFEGDGIFHPDQLRQHHRALANFGEEALKLGIALSRWGPDAFYAAARGYAVYQFVAQCTWRPISSPTTARSYVARIVAFSRTYCAVKLARPETEPPAAQAQTTATAASTPVPDQSVPPPPTANDRYSIERGLLEGGAWPNAEGFPKKIYLGSTLPSPPPSSSRGTRPAPDPDTTCPDGGAQKVINWYVQVSGKFDDKEFRAGEVVARCSDQINGEGYEAINGMLGKRLGQLVPRAATRGQYQQMADDIVDALNSRVRYLKDAKAREDAANKPPPQPEGQSDETRLQRLELQALERMALGLLSILAKT